MLRPTAIQREEVENDLYLLTIIIIIIIIIIKQISFTYHMLLSDIYVIRVTYLPDIID